VLAAARYRRAGRTWQDDRVLTPPPRLSSRRAFLRGALAVAGIGAVAVTGLAGCDPTDSPPPAPTADPTLDAFLADTVALGHRYDVVIAGLPELASRLTPLRDAHTAHAAAFARAIGRTVPSPVPSNDTAPAGAAAALISLAAAEKAGQSAAGARCLDSDIRLAPLLGSIAAARATHQEVLK
jgi:hypothetical protein